MRGSDGNTGSMFSYVDLEKRVPETHPLRLIKTITNDVLASLDAAFAGMYSDIGRPSIPPEQLLRASLLQAFFAIRSERQMMEQLHLFEELRPAARCRHCQESPEGDRYA